MKSNKQIKVKINKIKALRKNKIYVFACTDILNKQKVFCLLYKKVLARIILDFVRSPIHLYGKCGKKFGRNKIKIFNIK